jgi:hypothetical protein
VSETIAYFSTVIKVNCEIYIFPVVMKCPGKARVSWMRTPCSHGMEKSDLLMVPIKGRTIAAAGIGERGIREGVSFPDVKYD